MEMTKKTLQAIDSLNAYDDQGAQDILDYMSRGGDTSDRSTYGRYTELNPSVESCHNNFILPTECNHMSGEEMIAYYEARDKKVTLLERLINIFK